MKTSVLSTPKADRATQVASELKSRPAENYVPPLWDRFPSKLASVEQAPEPLRVAMQDHLSRRDNVRLIVFGPASRLFGKRSSATLLVVTDTGWLMAGDTDDGHAEVAQCGYENTLLIELTAILLRGQLKIDFASQGRAQFVTAEFNTVMEEYYQQAAQLLLDGIDGVATTVSGDMKNNHRLLESLPLKLQNAMLHYQPIGQRLIEIVRWPAVFGGKHRWLQHEVAPEALLALTDRDLLFISEEKSSAWFRAKRQAKYGNIVTYCPLSRLAKVKLNEHDLLDTIDLELRAAQGSEKLKIPFPREQKAGVSKFIEGMEKQRCQLA
jgi:hypothetical protein